MAVSVVALASGHPSQFHPFTRLKLTGVGAGYPVAVTFVAVPLEIRYMTPACGVKSGEEGYQCPP